MTGTGIADAGTTVPAGAKTGGVKVYQGVLMQTGTKARRAAQVCVMSLWEISLDLEIIIHEKEAYGFQ